MVKPFFTENAGFFQLFSTIKKNLWMKWYKGLIYVLFYTSSTKTSPSIAILTWFLILGKIQVGGQDGDHCCWRHRPPAAPPPIKYTSHCWEDQRLSTKSKIVPKHCNIPKTLVRDSINPPPPPLYHVGGMNMSVCPRVKLRLS